jgi:hypothetical protein
VLSYRGFITKGSRGKTHGNVLVGSDCGGEDSGVRKRQNGVEIANCETVAYFSKWLDWKAFRLFALKLAGELAQIRATA